MPRDTFEFRVAFRKLLIGLIFTVVPVSLVALYAISQSADNMERAIGTHFKAIAEATAVQVADFVHGGVQAVGFMAADSAVIDEVASANRSYRGMSETAINAKIAGIDDVWTTPAADAIVKKILSAQASHDLRRFIKLDPRFLRVTVTDERGATVASTHKTIDYYQADEEYWQRIYAKGRGGVSLRDTLYDEVTKSNYIGIGVPILEEDSNRVVGTLDALMEVSSLFPIVRRGSSGSGARTLLVKDDGTVVSGPNISLSMNQKSEEHAAVLDSLSTIEGRQTGYVVADFGDLGEKLIGFADTGLKEDFTDLGWVVLVSQPTSEAFAPLAALQRLIILLAFLALGAVVALAVYFSLHRKTEAEELEEEFHPGHPDKAASA